jgi:2'-5' RNA ligase
MPDKLTREYLRDSIRVLSKANRNLRFVPIDQLHITLQFIGNSVSSASMNLISERLKSFSGPKPHISLTEMKFVFQGQANASVLFWDLEDDANLKQVTRDIHTTIQDLELFDIKPTKDQAKLIHHITLARTKRTFSKREVANLLDNFHKNFTRPLPEFDAAEFVIIESHLNKNGNAYKVLEAFPFK